ncbi:MAG TPA: U32 family peptidase [Candidatus Nanoarchaeia archaeon]|nr:U32 family peptidase [Candidatus Nanoarchaeia archaeon]
MPKPDKPELLSPVSDLVSLKAAIDAGADAVYFGLKELNMRITAKNFDLGQLRKVVKICHGRKVKAYLVLNTIIYSNELKRVNKIIEEAKKAKVDAVICWDASVIEEVRKAGIPLHISTQASVSNTEAARFYKKLGAKRIVLARELSLKQISEIRKKAKIGVEVFVHGAMCVSVSGRCFMSQFVFGRSANRGDCLQPCRREYLIKDTEDGYELELGRNHVMSPKDLCALPFIEKLIEAKIDAFKIEGRARSPEYVKVVTECYREAIDAYFEKKLTKQLKTKLMKKLETVYNRGFSSGFYLGKPINEWASPETKATEVKRFIGVVRNYYKKHSVAEIRLQAGGIKAGDRIMFQGPTTGVLEQKVSSMQVSHRKVSEAGKGKNAGVKIKGIVRKNDKVFVVGKR